MGNICFAQKTTGENEMYRKSSEGLLKHLDFMLLDVSSFLLAFIIAFAIRFGTLKGIITEYITTVIVLTLIDVVTLVFLETLKNVLKRPTEKEIYITLRHVISVSIFGIVYLYIAHIAQGYSRGLTALNIVFYLILSFFSRYLWKKHLINRIHKNGRKSLFIITTSDMVDEILNETNEYSFNLYSVNYVLLTDKEVIEKENEKENITILGMSDDVLEVLKREWIDEVLVVIRPGNPYPNELINNCLEAGITVHTSLIRVSTLTDKKQFIDRVGSYDVLTTTSNYYTRKQVVIKRAVDILGGIVGCIITGIIFIFIAPIIYIKSPGPIFFKQIRVGQNGKKFYIYKFRSMYMDAEERKKELLAQNKIKDGMMFKMDFDPRIIGNYIDKDGKQHTGIGQFIRSASLDEFPQFYNVLKGDMSIVGTRPPTVDEWEKYETHHRSRLAVKPGVTGMWQTSGRSDITDFEEVIKLDNFYISHWDIWLDVKLILKTIKVIIERKGSQ